jgi:mono/diheme cytochrome c family protein
MRIFVTGVATGITVSLLGIALLAYFWPWQVEATRAPSDTETWLLQKILDKAVARQAPSVATSTAISEDDLRAGMKIFLNGCAGCHGSARHPSEWGTTSFFPRVPQFSANPTHKPAWQIHWIVKNGIRNTGMAGWEHLISDDQIWKVSMFVSRIGSLPPTIDAEWRAPP